MAKTVSEILSAAADLLEKPGAWTQGAFSRNADGSADYGEEDEEPIVAANPVCWCALGAIAQVTGESPLAFSTFSLLGGGATARARQAVNEILGKPLETWNDAPERTQDEVVAKLREAAELAKQGEA